MPKGRASNEGVETSAPRRITDSGKTNVYVPDFKIVKFASKKQQARFEAARATSVYPTRFVDEHWLEYIGVGGMVRELLNGTGLALLFYMDDPTYEVLTREFISSFNYDSRKLIVTFRLANVSRQYTLVEFGNFFGFPAGGITSFNKSFNYEVLWGCMTGRVPDRIGNLKINDIGHPALRIWFRIVANTIFGRPEAQKSNKNEMAILESYLNVERRPRFQVDLADRVASHFAKVEGLSQIEIGGLVTHIASQLNVDFTKYTPLGTLFMDRDYFVKLGWVSSKYTLGWKLKGGETLNLPCELPALTPQSPMGEDEEPTPLPSYVVYGTGTSNVPPRGNRNVGGNGGNDDAPPGYETGLHEPESSNAYTMPPTGNAPTMPPMGQSSFFPPPPPFYGYAPPEPYSDFTNSWNEFAVGANMTMYPYYHEHVVSGRVPREGPHPPFYGNPDELHGGYPGHILTHAGIRNEDYHLQLFSRAEEEL